MSNEELNGNIAKPVLGAVVFSNVRESKLKKSMRKRQCFKCEGKIEKGETLNKLSRILGFHEFAIFARNIELAGGRVNNVNIMEDIFEAFMGALSLETSFENCKIFLTRFPLHCSLISFYNPYSIYSRLTFGLFPRRHLLVDNQYKYRHFQSWIRLNLDL